MKATTINIKDYDLLRCNQRTLKDISKDSSKDVDMDKYMTSSKKEAVDFDIVKKKYLNKYGMSEEFSKSVDAVCQVSDNDIYFIEFKNGDFTSNEIKEKCLDSVLIFNSLTETQIEYDRANVSFILVYNSEVKTIDSKGRKAYQLALRAKIDDRPFGLNKLYGFIFKQVYVMDKDEFEAKFINKYMA